MSKSSEVHWQVLSELGQSQVLVGSEASTSQQLSATAVRLG